MKLKRRWSITGIVLLAGTMIVCTFLAVHRDASAAPKDVKIGVVYPLSGAPARNGNLMVQGVKAAFGWVNDNGGIKSLDGAKLIPVIADTGVERRRSCKRYGTSL